MVAVVMRYHLVSEGAVRTANPGRVRRRWDPTVKTTQSVLRLATKVLEQGFRIGTVFLDDIGGVPDFVHERPQ